jgi:hypothetical protein
MASERVPDDRLQAVGGAYRLYHQCLTGDVGNPKLREHLTRRLLLMKYSPDFSTFLRADWTRVSTLEQVSQYPVA